MALLVSIVWKWRNNDPVARRYCSLDQYRQASGIGHARRAARRPGGYELPLSIFPTDEQRRIKASLGVRELPAALAELRTLFAFELKRATERHAGGAMSDEGFAAKSVKVNLAWQKALSDAKLPPDEIAYWKGRLK